MTDTLVVYLADGTTVEHHSHVDMYGRTWLFTAKDGYLVVYRGPGNGTVSYPFTSVKKWETRQ